MATNYTLKIDAGADYFLAVRLRDEEGELIELTNCTGRMALKQTYDSPAPLVSLSSDEGGGITFDRWDDDSPYIDTCAIHITNKQTGGLGSNERRAVLSAVDVEMHERRVAGRRNGREGTGVAFEAKQVAALHVVEHVEGFVGAVAACREAHVVKVERHLAEAAQEGGAQGSVAVGRTVIAQDDGADG